MTFQLCQHHKAAQGQKGHFDSLKVLNGEIFVLDRYVSQLKIFIKGTYGMIKI